MQHFKDSPGLPPYIATNKKQLKACAYNVMYSSSSAVYDVSEVHKLCSSGQSVEHSAFAYTEDGRCGVTTSKRMHRQNLPACAQVFQWDQGAEPRCGLGQSPQKPDIFKQFAAVKMSILHPPTGPNPYCSKHFSDLRESHDPPRVRKGRHVPTHGYMVLCIISSPLHHICIISPWL